MRFSCLNLPIYLAQAGGNIGINSERSEVCFMLRLEEIMKKINSGIFRVWADRTKNDLSYLQIMATAYIAIKVGFVFEWWHVIAFVLFIIGRTVWDHKKVIPQQIDFWLNQSKIVKEIREDIKQIRGK